MQQFEDRLANAEKSIFDSQLYETVDFEPSKVALGKIGEQVVYGALKIAFRNKYRIAHVNWHRYNTEIGHGVDLKLIDRKGYKIKAVFEVKNWKILNRPYGTEIAVKEIISRFQGYTKTIKILVITSLKLLTKKAIELIYAHGIRIVEVGKLLGRKDFKSRFIYELAFKLKFAVKNKPKTSPTDYYSSIKFIQTKLVAHVNQASKQHIEQKQYDTERVEKLVKQALNYILEQIKLEKLREEQPLTYIMLKARKEKLGYTVKIN